MYRISPNFTPEKLESPSYLDIVDVFEDRLRNWLLSPATHLLSLPSGEVAAVALALSYFEGIEIYCSGKDSKNQSRVFFRNGFQRVFAVDHSGEHVYNEVADALYDQARCGFAHDGLFRHRVFFSNVRLQALNVTWPRKNGIFVKGGHLESVVINPRRFCKAIDVHFARYVDSLRAETDAVQKANFLSAVDLKWALNEPEPFIGMTEEDFRGGA